MTQLRNLRSRAVMDRLGMQEAVGEEFEHPQCPSAPMRARCACTACNAPPAADNAGQASPSRELPCQLARKAAYPQR